MLGLPPRGPALGPGGRLGRSGRGSGRLCDRSWPTDPWPWRSRALAWGLPLRSAAPRRPKPRLRVVRSPRWPPRSPGRDAPLGGGPGAFPCQRGRWRRRRRTRLPSPAGRGARRPLGAPWKRPPPRKPPCALMDHTWHLLGLLWPVLADAGSLPTCLGEALATVRALFAKRGARGPCSFLRSFWTRAGAGLSRPPGRFYDRPQDTRAGTHTLGPRPRSTLPPRSGKGALTTNAKNGCYFFGLITPHVAGMVASWGRDGSSSLLPAALKS